ncbi:MAG: hypothetical protein L0Z62_04325 [Gemmataceae bacterium]|nr:hypothetical protein [Gemmataceae bacterium]
MAQPAKALHLISDPLPSLDTAPATSVEKLVVPEGISHLLAVAGEAPRLVDGPGEPGEEVFTLEPVSHRGQDYLLVIAPRDARCNGQRLPRVALLGIKDALQLDGHTLHLTVFHRPRVGPPAPDIIGHECPLCRLPFVAETRVYLCPHCDTPLHCEGEEKPPDERLECVYLGSDCPGCHRPIVLTEGYAYLPEVEGV